MGTQPQRVVLVHPGVIAGLRAVVADALEAGSGILVEGPTFRAVIARGVGTIERPLALAAIEGVNVAAAHRHPHDTFPVTFLEIEPSTVRR